MAAPRRGVGPSVLQTHAGMFAVTGVTPERDWQAETVCHCLAFSPLVRHVFAGGAGHDIASLSNFSIDSGAALYFPL